MGRGKRHRGRRVDGILLLDKPSGLTSNAALQEAKRAYGAAKAGHTGSLDPLASGMLPVCFGQATKISGFLLDASKAYVVTADWGRRTDTADADGQVIEDSAVEEISLPTGADSEGVKFIGRNRSFALKAKYNVHRRAPAVDGEIPMAEAEFDENTPLATLNLFPARFFAAG